MDAVLIEPDHRADAAATAPEGERARTRIVIAGRVAAAIIAPVLGALPLLVLLGALVRDRPQITAYGDRAVSALAIRDLLGGHQLLGAYSRYGWHHPGPAFFLPLAAAHVALGGASWALDAGMIVAAAVPAAAIVAIVGHRVGWRAGFATAGALGVYLHAIAPVTLRDPWNPWGLLLPMALLAVLGAAAATGSLAALSGAALVATLLVQTHVGAAPVSVALLVTAAVLCGRGRASDRGDHAGWSHPAVVVPLVVAVALWVPPIAQQAIGSDPNLSELWRFFIHGSTGHNLPTAVAAVGSRLRLIPFGNQAGLMATSPTVGWGGAVAGSLTIGGYLAAAAGLAAWGHRRGNLFARGAGVLTTVAIVVSVFAVRSVQGPLDGFLVAWVTAIPVGMAAGLASLLPANIDPDAPRRKLALAVTSVTLAWCVFGTLIATRSAADAPSATIEDAPAVRAAWAQLGPRLVGHKPDAVLLRVADPYGWPVQAGLALLVEQHGWHAHVTDDWAFMFGSSRRMTGVEPLVATLRAVTPLGPEEQLTLDISPTFPVQDGDSLTTVSGRIGTVLGASVLGELPLGNGGTAPLMTP